jgi:hypothetical protein
MVYDYETPFQINGYSSATESINKIISSTDTAASVGLFSKFQFTKFKGTALSETVSAKTLDQEIGRIRAPTTYEAANYLIPTPNDFNVKHELDSYGFIPNEPEDLTNGYERYRGNIYAPLYADGNDQADLLFKNSAEVVSTIHDFMRAQETGMKKYKMALNRAAKAIDKQKINVAPGAVNSAEGYEKAARGVSDINFSDNSLDQMPKTCSSIAGQFLYFYYGGGVGTEVPTEDDNCPKPLGVMIEEYFNKGTADKTYSPTYYAFDLNWKKGIDLEQGSRLMTAYRPGPFTGVEMTGDYQSPIDPSITDVMRRNSYSTKFIALDSLRTGKEAQWDNEGFVIYSEGSINVNGQAETDQTEFANPLETTENISSIKY